MRLGDFSSTIIKGVQAANEAKQETEKLLKYPPDWRAATQQGKHKNPLNQYKVLGHTSTAEG